MKNFKRILALIGAILLVTLYILTFISAFTASPHSHALFLACIYSTIIIPIFLYAMILIYKITRPASESLNESMEEDLSQKEHNQNKEFHL